jgi:hypothetical protein
MLFGAQYSELRWAAGPFLKRFLWSWQSPQEPWFAVAECVVEPIAYLGIADQVWRRLSLRVAPAFVFYYKITFDVADFGINVISDLLFGQDGLLRSGSFEQSLLDREEDWPLHAQFLLVHTTTTSAMATAPPPQVPPPPPPPQCYQRRCQLNSPRRCSRAPTQLAPGEICTSTQAAVLPRDG